MGVDLSANNFTPTLIRSSDLSSGAMAAQKGGDRDHVDGLIGRFIQKLWDMIGGTNYTDLKKYAFDLHSSSTTDIEKFEAFEKIRQLAGDGIASRFRVEDHPADGVVSLIIELGDGDIHQFDLSRKELFFEKSESDVVGEDGAHSSQEAAVGQLMKGLAGTIGIGSYTSLKECAFELYSSDSTDRQKFEAFDKLRVMAGEESGQYIRIEGDGRDSEVANLVVELDGGEIHSFQVSKRELFFEKLDVGFDQNALNEEFSAMWSKPLDEKQWGLDVVRSGVQMGGEVLRTDDEVMAKAKADVAAGGLGCTDSEITQIKKFCVQTINAIIWNRALAGVQVNCSTAELQMSYEVYRDENGKLNIDARVDFNGSTLSTVDSFIEYMSYALPSEVGMRSDSGKPILQLREANLVLNFKLSSDGPPDVHLGGHMGKYSGPQAPMMGAGVPADNLLMPSVKA